MSERDLAAGERWGIEVGQQLQGTEFGIIVLTQDNVTAPWILFEAGAISKAFSAGRVCPFLVDIDFKDVSGPLSQFQAKKSDRQSTRELLESINAQATAVAIPEPQLDELFDALWQKFEKQLTSLPPVTALSSKTRTQGQILEDLVETSRRMEARIEGLVAALPARAVDFESVTSPTTIVSLTILDTDLERMTDMFQSAVRAVGIPYDQEITVHIALTGTVIEAVSRFCGLDSSLYGKAWFLALRKQASVTLPGVLLDSMLRRALGNPLGQSYEPMPRLQLGFVGSYRVRA